MNCSQFKDDFDVLRQFPYPIRVNPGDDDFGLSIAQLNKDNKTIRMLWLKSGQTLPSSVFCFSNFTDLILEGVYLKDGNFAFV